jgi:ABC-type uncharacterized transport system involved in gliding motility auxiliary subunit
MLNKILNSLSWLGPLFVFAAVVVWFLLPELGTLRRVLAFAGLVAILLYAAAHWRQVARSFEGRRTRYGTLAGTSLLLVLAIVAGLNYVLARQNQRWDLTAARQYSLSDQTRRVLDSLSEPVRILVFAQEPQFPQFQDRLDQYAYQSSQVTIDYIDADRQPLVARQYEVQTYGTIIFEYGGRTERVESTAEQDLTNALIKVVEGTEQTVYFLEGHGEKTPTDTEREGLSSASSALELDNFAIESLLLAQQGRVPSDATVVIVAGPETDLLPGEIEALGAYLVDGGKLMILVDPATANDAPRPEGLLGLTREWGIEIGDGIVVDASGVGQLFGADASVPVAANYPVHPITDRFNLLTAYPLARSVNAADGAQDGRVPQTFIETSGQSWVEANIDGLTTGQVELNEEDGDQPGPVPIGMAVSVAASGTAPVADSPESDVEAGENSDGASNPPETRLVVIGDSDFATNAVVGVQGNRDMFLNAINWLAQQENLISIRAREPEDRRLTLTADQERRIFWFSIFLLPAAVLGAGVYTWWRRQ